ncbi:MFS transporter [Pigmentibacter ruber]|uniref:MFS transporter n=1 Tax=Pigmentibacter ruber TaxID=2683196 RepID=UPI00131C1498|nr:MFS transporter [Pigmentibacter ruber]
MSKNVSNVSYLFVYFLVLYEFSVYISNDMIMPGMIYVIQDFKVDNSYIPSALSLYIFGGSCLQLFVGYFAEKYGKRKLLLYGIMSFILGCMLNSIALNIYQFLLARIIQGLGIAFISAIGYATVQETFPEKKAVKIIAFMTSVSILAPLVGPLIGSLYLQFFHWRGINIFITFLATIAFIGLYFSFPKDNVLKNNISFIEDGIKLYTKILLQNRFLFGVLTFTFAQFPLILWISVSPILLIQNEKISFIKYGFFQFPIFGGFIAGTTLLQLLLKKFDLRDIIVISAFIIFSGLLTLFFTTFYLAINIELIMILLSIYTFGLGCISSPLIRTILYSYAYPKTAMTALFSFINMIILSMSVEFFSNYIKNVKLFSNILFGSLLCFSITIFLYLNYTKERKKII